jgi:hypothetical protein
MPKQPKAFSPSGYYRVRLEHTLKHTQQATRLIYLVNGATLGVLYFAAKLEEIVAYRRVVIGAVLGILAAINFVHGCLIQRQGHWYASIDKAFSSSSGAERIERPKGFPWLGTHALYALVHYGLALALMAACLFVLWALAPQSK